MLKLDIIRPDDLIIVKDWRNMCPEALRTCKLTSDVDQINYYKKLNEDNSSRFWAVKRCGSISKLVGFSGLNNIQHENRLAEINIIINPTLKGKGYGGEIIDMILDQAFNLLNLKNVYGECYYCNPDGIQFWGKIIEKYKGFSVDLPNRKYFLGEYWPSLYFNLSKEGFANAKKN
jgi:RimJ/RimL family protein N-acetyltransferase